MVEGEWGGGKYSQRQLTLNPFLEIVCGDTTCVLRRVLRSAGRRTVASCSRATAPQGAPQRRTHTPRCAVLCPVLRRALCAPHRHALGWAQDPSLEGYGTSGVLVLFGGSKDPDLKDPSQLLNDLWWAAVGWRLGGGWVAVGWWLGRVLVLSMACCSAPPRAPT